MDTVTAGLLSRSPWVHYLIHLDGIVVSPLNSLQPIRFTCAIWLFFQLRAMGHFIGGHMIYWATCRGCLDFTKMICWYMVCMYHQTTYTFHIQIQDRLSFWFDRWTTPEQFVQNGRPISLASSGSRAGSQLVKTDGIQSFQFGNQKKKGRPSLGNNGPSCVRS